MNLLYIQTVIILFVPNLFFLEKNPKHFGQYLFIQVIELRIFCIYRRKKVGQLPFEVTLRLGILKLCSIWRNASLPESLKIPESVASLYFVGQLIWYKAEKNKKWAQKMMIFKYMRVLELTFRITFSFETRADITYFFSSVNK